MHIFADGILHDKVVLVTGGGTGIGRGIALGMAGYGAHLVLASRHVDHLRAVAQEAQAQGVQALPVRTDVREPAQVQALIQVALDTFGRIDVLVNNAGTNRLKPALEVTEEDWDTILDTNLKGLFFLTQAVARGMIERKSGKIINIASQAGLVGGPLRAPYCASKGGVVNMTRALAAEWAPYTVTVNGVAPTVTRTPLAERAMQNPVFRETVERQILLGRLAEPEEIAGAVLYLASDAANMVTGQTIAVDGGWTAV